MSKEYEKIRNQLAKKYGKKRKKEIRELDAHMINVYCRHSLMSFIYERCILIEKRYFCQVTLPGSVYAKYCDVAERKELEKLVVAIGQFPFWQPFWDEFNDRCHALLERDLSQEEIDQCLVAIKQIKYPKDHSKKPLEYYLDCKVAVDTKIRKTINGSNGAKFISMYKPFRVIIEDGITTVYQTKEDAILFKSDMKFKTSWWNAPYKRNLK